MLWKHVQTKLCLDYRRPSLTIDACTWRYVTQLWANCLRPGLTEHFVKESQDIVGFISKAAALLDMLTGRIEEAASYVHNMMAMAIF